MTESIVQQFIEELQCPLWYDDGVLASILLFKMVVHGNKTTSHRHSNRLYRDPHLSINCGHVFCKYVVQITWRNPTPYTSPPAHVQGVCREQARRQGHYRVTVPLSPDKHQGMQPPAAPQGPAIASQDPGPCATHSRAVRPGCAPCICTAPQPTIRRRTR